MTNLFTAFTISLFPLNYFFQFLYYTDVGSTLFILLCYYYQLKSNYYLSGFLGAIAVLFRQTNIVWVGFCVLLIILSNIERLVRNQDSKLSAGTNDIGAIISQKNKKHSNLFEFVSKSLNDAFNKEFDLKNFLHKLYREDFWGKKIIYLEIFQVVDMNLLRPYMMVISTFLFFVAVNNGIVVGDRSNHQASFHLVQIFYFVAFSCFFTFSSFLLSIKQIKNLYSFISRNFLIIVGIILPLFCLIVSKFTYEHPFLLADNRHYTFYIWSRVFKRHEAVKFVLTPVYLVSIYLFFKNLSNNGSRITLGWILAYSLCTFASLVPQKLLEFRYFIIPYYIYRLNLNRLGLKQVFLEFFLYAILNAATIYLYLNRVFHWPNSKDDQRFMW